MITGTYTITKVNDLITWVIKFKNKNTPNSGVYVNLNIPGFLKITGNSVSQGSISGNAWNIGDMLVNQSVLATITLKANTLPADGDYNLEAIIFGFDTNPNNNKIIDAITVKKKVDSEPKPPCNNTPPPMTEPHTHPKKECGEDPCAEPNAPIVQYEHKLPLLITGKVPSKCDIGKTAYSAISTTNAKIEMDAFTGYYEILQLNAELPWEVLVDVSCKVKCFTRVFGPTRIYGPAICKPVVPPPPVVDAPDKAVTKLANVPTSENLAALATYSASCAPVTFSVVSDTTTSATIAGGILNYTPKLPTEKIGWKATCANGTTVDEGILTVTTTSTPPPPVPLNIQDGSIHEIDTCSI